MLTFTFAGDEAGDVSLSFEKGASRYLVMAVVATQDADALRSVLIALRCCENLPIRHEFSRIFFRRSRSKDLIQVADLVAGAILRRNARKDSDAFELIEDKVQAIFEFAEMNASASP
ncbi:MAG: DUF3800 domain-containing protein [Chloroflexota bacterium]